MRGPKRGSGPRSNSYSESKCSNWQPFNPFHAEMGALPKNMTPAAKFSAPGLERLIPIFSKPAHSEFVHPCEPADVCGVLSRVPCEFLRDIREIYILGGTTKQIRSMSGPAFRFGCYENWSCCIILHAFPKSLTLVVSRRPRPMVAREYTRWGAEFLQTEDGTSVRFTPESLRRFFLYDVLLHEIGHHVDRFAAKNRKQEERFAVWFALEQTRALKLCANAE